MPQRASKGRQERRWRGSSLHNKELRVKLADPAAPGQPGRLCFPAWLIAGCGGAGAPSFVAGDRANCENLCMSRHVLTPGREPEKGEGEETPP